MDELFKLLEEEVIYWNIMEEFDDHPHYSSWAPIKKIIKSLPYKNKFIKIFLKEHKYGTKIIVRLEKAGILKMKILKTVSQPEMASTNWKIAYNKILEILKNYHE